MINRIHHAIKNNDRKALEECLTDENLSYFLQQDLHVCDGSPALHIAITEQNADAAILILRYLKKQQEPVTYLKMTDSYGNNILHLAALHSTYPFLQILLDELGDEAENLARTANKYYVLPMVIAKNGFDRLLRNKDNSAADKQQYENNFKNKKLCHDLLLKIALSGGSKKLSEKLDPNEVLSRYSADKENVSLCKHIEVGCKILNYARSVIIGSTTHPRYHHYSQNKQKDIIQRITKARGSALRMLRKLDTRVEYIAQYKGGNCWEYAQLCMYKAKRIERQSHDHFRVEFCQLAGWKYNKPGRDHVVIVMGRADDATNDPKTWGPKAIIVDAWSGLIYRPYEIAEYFTDYYSYCSGTPINNEYSHRLSVPYNPAVHQFEVFSSRSLIGRLLTRMGDKDVSIGQTPEWNDESDIEDEMKEEQPQLFPGKNNQPAKITPLSIIDDEKSVNTELINNGAHNFSLFARKSYAPVNPKSHISTKQGKCCTIS